MQLYKTDKRFDLYRHGFETYVEFHSDDWNGYNRYTRGCRQYLGDEFWAFAGYVYTNGNWKGVYEHRSRRWRSKRVYLKSTDLHTMLLLTFDDNANTVYLG